MRRLTSVLLTLLLLAGTAPVFGQGVRGSLTGLVSDQNGAAISGATVTVKNVATGEEFRANTNSQGAFTFPSLPPGKYTATVEASGFKRTEVLDITVEVSQAAKVDVGLEIGAVNEQVTVTGQAQEIINTTSPVLSKTINARQVKDLPLLSRNPLDLARLQTGIAVNGTNVRGASVQGLRGSATNVTQDGINAMDNFVKTDSFFAITAPTLGATNEFSITVGTVGSDAGRGVAQVQMVTKSGSNEFHGSLFYQHRNDALNANSFFNNASNTPRPIQRQHFFGGTASGPVWIPKIYDGRNKSHWFFSYEGFREPFSATRNRTVLTEEARRGIYRYTGANGQTQTVNLLSLGNFRSLNALTTEHLNAMPAANNTLNGDGFNTAGFRYNVSGKNKNNRYDVRYDQELFSSEKWGSHKLEGVLHRGIFLLTPDTFNGLEERFPGAGGNAFQASDRNLWAGAIHSTFGAYATNEARFGHQEYSVGFLRESFPDAPFITFGSGVTALNNTFMSQGRNVKLNQIIDNFSLVKGAHTFRMGTDIQIVHAFTFNDAGINQTINIGTNSANPDGLVTANFPNLPAGSAGSSIFNLARGIYRDLTGSLGSTNRVFNVTNPTSGFVPNATRGRRFLYNDVSFYFQDAWRVKRNFTFNYGTRWEYLGVPSLPDGLGLQITNFDDILGISGPGNLFKPGVTGGNASATLDFVSGDSGRRLHQRDWNNFAPFIGFAWSPSFEKGPLHWILGGEGRSSIRGGFSISYLRDGFTVISNALGVGTTNPGLIQTAANTVPTGVLGSGNVSLTTPTFKIPITSSENFGANPNNGLWAIDPNLRTPYVQQWSFGIERELTSNMALEVRYAGNHAVKIFRAIDYNEVNIFENGFLQEFLNAQKNLAINLAAGSSSFVAGRQGTVPLPILGTLFTGVSNASGFGSTGFIANLQQNNIGAMAQTLAFSPTYRNGRAGLAPNFFVANPNAAFARILGNNSYSNYHSLQVELRRRYAQGLTLQGSYTLSKTFTDSNGSQSTLENYFTLRSLSIDRALSDQDQRHRFVANAVYDLPVGTGRRYLNSTWSPIRKALEGWTLGAIFTYQTSSPFYISSGRSTFNSIGGGTPAQLVGMTFDEFKKNLGVYKTPVGVFFINPSLLNIVTNPTTGQLTSSRIKDGIFGVPAPGTFGNFPLNSLNGPDFTQTDLSLVKRTYFSERGNVEFRMIAFNIFNRPSFTIGGVNFDAANFLRITNTTGQVRELSFNITVNW